jgi:hypothetical protein
VGGHGACVSVAAAAVGGHGARVGAKFYKTILKKKSATIKKYCFLSTNSPLPHRVIYTSAYS